MTSKLLQMEFGEYLDPPDSPELAKETYDDFSNTFGKRHEISDFEKVTICAPPGCYTCHGNQELEAHISTVRVDAEDISEFGKTPDPCQLFYVGRRSSFSRLGISRQLFEHFCHVYDVFSSVWDFILPFGFKSKGSDIGQAAFKFRQNEPLFLPAGSLGSFECAYGFCYSKLNGRDHLMNGNPDYDPWSIRQVAVYQQYNSLYDRLTFLLVAPSDEVRRDLEHGVLRLRRENRRLNAFALHFIILTTLHDNWGLYLRDLGNILKIQSDSVMVAQVRSDVNSISETSDLPVTFLDRQRLQLIEEKILDLMVIFESIADTILKLRSQCARHCLAHACVDCACATVCEDFEDLERDVRLNLKKAEILHKRARSATQLLTNLLDFENAQIAHINEKSLNILVAGVKDENAKMMVLTERSTRDAAAVRILTVITLIYLPMTVVAGFFSSQLIQVSESGRVSIVSDAWVFAAVSIPLTLVTFFGWKFWLSYALKARDKKLKRAANNEKLPELWWYRINWPAIWRHLILFALRNRGKREDNYNGNTA